MTAVCQRLGGVVLALGLTSYSHMWAWAAVIRRLYWGWEMCFQDGTLMWPPNHTLLLPPPWPVFLTMLALCFRGKFDPQDMDKNVIAIQTVSGILQGPFDLGNQLLGLKGVMEMMVALCGSERETDQLVAVEALIHASTKLSRATFIITNGVSLLKEIYKTTKNEKIKIRTLVVSGPGTRLIRDTGTPGERRREETTW